MLHAKLQPPSSKTEAVVFLYIVRYMYVYVPEKWIVVQRHCKR